jgi:hypothetical protein
MWKNSVERTRPQMKKGACALHAGKLGLRLCNTFPLQHWFYESAPVLRYIYIAFLVMKSELQYRDNMILPPIINQRDFHLVHAATLHKSQSD